MERVRLKVRWSTLTRLCQETAELAGRGTACWIESPRGEVLAGERDNNARADRHPILISGREVASVCFSGPAGGKWARYLAAE